MDSTNITSIISSNLGTTDVVPATIKATRRTRARVSTDQDIRDLPTENKRYKVFVEGVANLFLFVTPKGGKSFAFLYQDANGAHKTHTLGKWGKFTLAQAVARFEKARDMLEHGECLRTAQLSARKKTAATLQTMFDDWFPNYRTTVGVDFAARTAAVMASTEMDELRNKRLASIDMPTLLEFCKRQNTVRSPGYAREVCHLVDKLVEHARSIGAHTGDNPAHGVVKKLPRRDSIQFEALQLEHVQRYFADLDAKAAQVNALVWRKQRPTKAVSPHTMLALRILPYITVRPSILRSAKWSWISWDGPNGAMLTVPAFEQGTKQKEKTKRADKRGKHYVAYRVPLSHQVVRLLRELQLHTGAGVYLFPGNKSRKVTGERPVSEGTWLAMLRAMGWDGETEERPAITCHGFRALFATAAYTRYIISRQEEHALEFQQDHALTEGVRANYTHDKEGSHRLLLLGARAAMLQWWADEIDAILAHQGAGLPQSRADMAAAFIASQGQRHPTLRIA